MGIVNETGGRSEFWAIVLLVTACFVFAISTVLMFLRVEPFCTWYYSLAWWPYILGAQAWLRLRSGKAELFSRPARFWSTALLSVSVWLVFEVFNFRLSNWHYVNLPPLLIERWAGYFVAFATVLPGLFTTRDLLAHAGVCGNMRCSSLREPHRVQTVFLIIGVFMFILPIVWPRYFFPLVWGSFVFLLEPVAYGLGGRSLLRDWEKGDPVEFVRLLVAGGICGGLWEMWNFWAGSKWVYTVPFVGVLKVFEMPVAGFLGFPPFAVECAVMAAVFFMMWDRLVDSRLGWILRIVLVLAALGFDLAVFAGIDQYTVVSFARAVP